MICRVSRELKFLHLIPKARNMFHIAKVRLQYTLKISVDTSTLDWPIHAN